VREIIDHNRYMTLATADAHGTPWASPVWFAHFGYRDFLWVSEPGARHSKNVAERSEIAIVIFDSRVFPDQAQAIYMTATAKETTDGIETYSDQSVAQGLPPWTLADVTAPARFRLYRASVTERWILTGGSVRTRA
jgi:nitroimidazol reductase NimA-like FMN-containing flavoprotein (pyridoxamine 5'-phosphate oxidase superfamily)